MSESPPPSSGDCCLPLRGRSTPDPSRPSSPVRGRPRPGLPLAQNLIIWRVRARRPLTISGGHSGVHQIGDPHVVIVGGRAERRAVTTEATPESTNLADLDDAAQRVCVCVCVCLTPAVYMDTSVRTHQSYLYEMHVSLFSLLLPLAWTEGTVMRRMGVTRGRSHVDLLQEEEETLFGGFFHDTMCR